MKEGWTYKKLPDLSDNLDSLRKPVTKKNRTAGIYPYYGASGIVDYVDDYLFDEDLLCISEDGANLIMRTYPIAFPISGKVWVNNHAHVLRFKSNVTQKYVEYFFAGIKLDKFVTGAAQPKLTQKALNNIKIKIPESVPEQQRIVERLDAAFENIDKLKANAEKQLAEAQTLFQKSLAKAMEPKVGWEKKKMKEITTKIGSGATPLGGRKVYINEGVSLVRSMNVHYNEFKYDELAHINDEAANQLNGVELKQNDVLFNITGASIARCCVLPNDVIPARVNQHVAILRPITEIILPQYLCLCLISSTHQVKLLKKGEAGSTRQALTKADLENYTISLPPLAEQQRIVERLDALSENIRKYEEIQRQIISECDALKQALLRKVFE